MSAHIPTREDVARQPVFTAAQEARLREIMREEMRSTSHVSSDDFLKDAGAAIRSTRVTKSAQ